MVSFVYLVVLIGATVLILLSERFNWDLVRNFNHVVLAILIAASLAPMMIWWQESKSFLNWIDGGYENQHDDPTKAKIKKAMEPKSVRESVEKRFEVDKDFSRAVWAAIIAALLALALDAITRKSHAAGTDTRPKVTGSSEGGSSSP